MDARRELVLVGGGHAHVQILRRLAMRPVGGVRTTVVLDRSEAVYSGMVPGFVAGEVSAAELEIDVVPLARRAGAAVVLAAAEGIDPVDQRIAVRGRPPLPYDIASLDVGATVRGLDLPGVRDHALATRPIRGLVDALETALGGPREGRLRVAVVGAGAAGVELAFTLEARVARAGGTAEVTLLASGADVLDGAPASVRARVHREAAVRGIAIRTGVRASAVGKTGVQLGDEHLPADRVLWATGAAPHPWLRAAPLPLDDDGFVRVGPTLLVEGTDTLFAVGDCASFAGERLPKAGVYAVRQGPALDRNLRAWLRGAALRPYRPQRDFLALLNLGDGRAIGTKWGRTGAGRGVWWLKDAIDRRFMRRFQVLDENAEITGDFRVMGEMGEGEMACGGCAAKLGAPVLERALARLDAPLADASVLLGLERPDDASAVRQPGGEVLLTTVDGFRAFADDPFLVGRVAALNAVSDVWAKGGTPRHALALVTLPEAPAPRSEELLYQVLAGVRAALDPHQIGLLGGHTTTGPELFVALSLTGIAASGESLLPLADARPGDALLLTKPLGTGVVLAADMQGRARGRWVAAALAAMLRANADAARIARACGAHASTDVSGFGLAGHLREMMRASGACALLDLARIPALPGAATLLGLGMRSTFHPQNRALRSELAFDPAQARHPAAELLFDPQTAGGLLLSLPAARAAEACAALHAAGDTAAAIIGRVVPARGDGATIAFEDGVAASAD